MNTTALILMISTMGIVTCITGYFYYKVLKTPPKEGDDERPEGFYEGG